MDLTAENVQAVFLDCLDLDATSGVKVHGVFSEITFHPARLKGHTEAIRGFLGRLSTRFYADRGGGHSFSKIGTRRDGARWGGRPDSDRLVSLGMGLGLVQFCMDRSRWHLFPDGYPFVRVAGDLFKLWATFLQPVRGPRPKDGPATSITLGFDADAHPAPPSVSDEDWYRPASFEVQDLNNVPTHVAESFYNATIVNGFFDDNLPSWILDGDTTLEVY